MMGGGSVGACAARQAGRMTLRRIRIRLVLMLDAAAEPDVDSRIGEHGSDDSSPLVGAVERFALRSEYGAPACGRNRRAAAVVPRANDHARQTGRDDPALPAV